MFVASRVIPAVNFGCGEIRKRSADGWIVVHHVGRFGAATTDDEGQALGEPAGRRVQSENGS